MFLLKWLSKSVAPIAATITSMTPDMMLSAKHLSHGFYKLALLLLPLLCPFPLYTRPHAHQLKERVSLRKHHDERLALRSQMGVDEAERSLIEDIKAEEKEKAEVGLHQNYCNSILG